jgi:hypothetical protein
VKSSIRLAPVRTHLRGSSVTKPGPDDPWLDQDDVDAEAAHLEQALQASESQADQDRRETRERLDKQHRALVSKLDRGYEDYVEGRISEDFWTRKSEQWEEERRSLEAEIARLDRPSAPLALTGQKILELAKQAGFLYRTQDPVEQRRLLDTVLSNCTFDRGSLCPTYNKPFDLFVRGNETGNWRGVWDDFRNWLIHAA